MTPGELRTAKISAASVLIGALIGGVASFGGVFVQTWFQTKMEVRKIRAETATQDRKDYLLKAEKLFGALSDLESFFDSNHSFEISRAKPVIAQARKDALEFAVYTSPDMALKSISVVEAMNQGVDANNPEQLKKALDGIFAFSQELVASFYKERSILDQDRSKALE